MLPLNSDPFSHTFELNKSCMNPNFFYLFLIETQIMNLLFTQVINHIYEQMGLFGAQRLATLLDGMTRHTPEGISFQQRCQEVGFKQAVKERDTGKASYSD